jgi:hypothetical protein
MKDLLENDVSGRMSSDNHVDSHGTSRQSASDDDLEKDEEDFHKILTDINNEAITELKNDDTKAAHDCLQRGE